LLLVHGVPWWLSILAMLGVGAGRRGSCRGSGS